MKDVLTQISEKVDELNIWLANYNLEAVVQPKKEKEEIPSSSPVAQKRKSGFSQYWDIIDKISKKEGITKHAARALYDAKKDEFATMTSAESVSKGMKIYWDKVRAIAKEKGITTKEARQFMPKPPAVQTNTVNI